MNQAFRFRGLLAALIVPFGISCIPFLPPAPSVRTVHLKIVVNSNFASHSLWRENVGNLVDNASHQFKSWIDVDFIIDTMMIWDIEQSECYTTMFRWDCLISQIPRGSSDLVLLLEKESFYRDIFAGMSMYDEGYLLVEQLSGSPSQAGYEKAFHVLLHELGHIFGAVHTYIDLNKPRVMDPHLHDGQVVKVGKAYEFAEPDFHDGNAIIMNALRKRAFSADDWDTADWKPIRSAYARARAEYSPWRYGESGNIANEEFDELREDEMYLFLASWASLCRKDSVALAYTDSLEALWSAIRSTCARDKLAGNMRICSRCGTNERTASEWFERMKNALLSERASLYLRWGRLASADSCFAAYIAHLPDEVKEGDRAKIKNGYAMYRARYAKTVSDKDTGSAVDIMPALPVTIDTIQMPVMPDSVSPPAIPDSLLE